MSEKKQRTIAEIEADLQKTQAELTIALHQKTKLQNQLKGMSEVQRRHRNIIWGSHMEYLLRNRLDYTKEQLAALDDGAVKDILDMLFSDLYFCRIMKEILAEKTGCRFPAEKANQDFAGR